VSQLERALDRGWLGFVPIAVSHPVFEPLQDYPRFAVVEAAMVEKINVERESLGLEPVDLDNPVLN
jgi:hypothetical protein